MNDINFEKDQEEVLDRTENLKSLADQVKNLRDLEDQVKVDEDLLKWDKQERKYYPIHINLFEKGDLDESN